MQGSDAQGVQSVEVGGSVLKALQSLGGSASLGDIAAAAGLHRGKIHRYLTSLVRTGLVEQNGRNGHYELGPLALSLGLTALRRQNPIARASQSLAALRDATDQSATLAVWGETGPVVVALEPSRHPVSMNVRIGTELPADKTALGRVFLSWQDKARWQDKTRWQDRAGAADEAQACTIDGDLLPGVAACAAPVFGHNGALLMAVGIVGRSEDFRDTAQLGDAVLAFADELSRSFGYAPSWSS